MIEPLIASMVVVAGAFAGAELLIFFRPWRSFEIYVALSITIALGISLSVLAARRKAYRTAWRVVLAACALLVAASYALLYFHHRETNLPSLAAHFDGGRATTGQQPKSAVSTQELWSHFRDRRPVPTAKLQMLYAQPLALAGEYVSQDSQSAMADAFLTSRYEFPRYPPAQLPEDLRWTEDPHDDRSWNWFLHVMSYVSILAEEYRRTHELSYLERAQNLILDWIADNSVYFFPVSEFSWNDHTTAFRLMNWLYFWEVWSKSPLFDAEKMAPILQSMLAHAERLADAGFYREQHNHGIDQDRALIAYTLVFPELEQSERWRSLALQRLEAQVLFAVSPNGVHLEHSPGYHLFALRQLQEITALFADWGIDDGLTSRLRRLMETMAKYVKHIVQPNGRLVPIGDTAVSRISDYVPVLAPLAKHDEAITCLLSDGDLCASRDDVAVFPDEGYVVIRDFDQGRLPFDKSLYLFFTAAAHEGRVHRQADDLSFVLSFGGHELLSDPGVYSYKRDAERSYVLSPLAHNTVAIDGGGWTFKHRNTRLDEFLLAEEFSAIKASHRNHEHFEHVRWLIHLKPSLLILVDTLEPKPDVSASELERQRHFTQLFHSSNEIELRVVGGGEEVWFLPSDGEAGQPLMRILQMGPLSAAPRIASGEQNPMLGWTSPHWGVLEPAPVVTFEIEGRNATFVTILELNMRQDEPADEPFIRSDFAAEIGASEIVIGWLQDGVERRVVLNRKAGSIRVLP